jgi:gliding motility-associated lipoprotein GldD
MNIKKLILPILLGFLLQSCQEDFSPKPRGYFRIDLPKKEYKPYDGDCPFVFDLPVYSTLTPDFNPKAEPCWLNLNFGNFQATLHLSYKSIKGNADQHIEQTRTLTYKHITRATDIRENTIMNPEEKVYGILYDVKGDAASPLQFFLTDSTSHFIRGALYFNAPPNSDSIAPVLNFIRQDIDRMVNSFRWENLN